MAPKSTSKKIFLVVEDQASVTSAHSTRDAAEDAAEDAGCTVLELDVDTEQSKK